MKTPELLAPAGSFEGLVSAVSQGADAVYLGLSEFSARAGAVNFTLEQLDRAVRYAHAREVRIYLALNTLIGEGEFYYARSLAEEADKIGVDAFLFQDLGLAMSLRDRLLAPFHASTQMTVINKEGARVLARLGFNRAVLARELSLEEIGEICSDDALETEVFCHGALCMSYSGQCMMSRFAGHDASSERSGNRGSCAQPCRMIYGAYTTDGENMTRYPKTYRMSPADLCSLPYLDKLVKCGVSSLKIEGRLKSPEYAALTVRTYRKALDNIQKDIFPFCSDDDIYELASQFSRGGFTSGHQLGKMPLSSITRHGPGHQGVLCGRVIRGPYPAEGNIPVFKVTASLSGDLEKGDTVMFGRRDMSLKGADPQNTGNVNVILFNGERVRMAEADQIVELTVSGKNLNISPGSDIFRMQNGPLTEEFSKIPGRGKEYVKRPVFARFQAKEGERARLYVRDRFGNESESFSSEPVYMFRGEMIPGKTPVLSYDTVYRSLSKTGDTPFYVASLDLDAEEGLFMTAGALNAMRRECLEKLLKAKEEGGRLPV